MIIKKVGQLIESLEISNKKQAQILCQLIPASCPFERDITMLGRTLLHIPAMCKLNPLFDSLMILRFRALTLLAQ